MRVSVLTFAMTALVMAPVAASAQERHAADEPALQEHARALTHGAHHVGVRLAWSNRVDARVREHGGEHEDATGFGVGLVGELPMWGPLELEWVGQVDRHGDALQLTEELCVKAPWHLSADVSVFLGAGGLLRQHSHGELLSGGVVGSAGGTYWLSEDTGVMVELEVIEDLALATREVEGIVTVMVRFDAQPPWTQAR